MRLNTVPEISLVIILCAFILIGACKSRPSQTEHAKVGGPCTYADIPGTATIISITPAKAEAYNCPKNPVEVLFDFTPADPALSAKKATGQILTVGGGMNPSREYVAAKGIQTGKILPCVRRDITRGTCTPVIFEFSGIDFSDYAVSCYGK